MTTPREDVRLLDEEDLQSIDTALQKAEDIAAELERARTAGIDVADRERRLQEVRTRLRAVKQSFFPGR